MFDLTRCLPSARRRDLIRARHAAQVGYASRTLQTARRVRKVRGVGGTVEALVAAGVGPATENPDFMGVRMRRGMIDENSRNRTRDCRVRVGVHAKDPMNPRRGTARGTVFAGSVRMVSAVVGCGLRTVGEPDHRGTFRRTTSWGD